jgi:septal ring-binding cell division protein DamX
MRERRLIMAVAKKSVAAPDIKSVTKTEDTKAAAKAVIPAAPVKAEAVKKEEPAKTAVKKETVKKEAVKKEAVKKTAAKKAAAPAKKASAKKAELKNELHIQFGGKSYSEEDILKIAKDVWKYDLKQKAGDLAGVELYVKPEENKVYYVMNKEFTGSFDI